MHSYYRDDDSAVWQSYVSIRTKSKKKMPFIRHQELPLRIEQWLLALSSDVLKWDTNCWCLSLLEEKKTSRSHSRLQCWVSSPAILQSWQLARMSPFACPQSPQGQTLMTKSISCSSVPLGGLSFTWILCVMVQNHLQESHLLLTAALTFHPMLGLWYQCVGRGLSLI